MAKIANRLSSNVPGEFFVDSGCIDCGVCQRMAPGTFDDAGEMARVFRQPEDRAAFDRALGALVSCPVSAIGTVTRVDSGSV
nr:ferredoxin [Nitrospiraceae bacterium]